jgi:DNA-binding NtrC family response regulator
MRPNDSEAARILVVDDDPVARRVLSDTLGRAGYTAVVASTATEALRLATDDEPALAILDLVLPDGDGIELLSQLRTSWPALPAIIVTAYTEPRSIVEAMRRGALDYLGKPVDPDVLLSMCRTALARRPALSVRADQAPEIAIIGGSPETAQIRETLTRWSRTRVAGALITGERGVGKRFLAHALHGSSHRRAAPCITYPCADAYAPAVALFGLPGGTSGLLAATQGGTLVLSDVDTLPAQVQAAVLDWLERHRSTAPAVVGLTAVADAQGPLLAWLGRARIDIPPLRDRTGDVLPLARHFLISAGLRLGRHFTRFTSDAEHRLVAHTWPGNVRELRDVIERVATAVPGGAIRQEQLALAGGDAVPSWMPTGEPRPLREIEDAYIDHVIALARGNKTRAAQLLGIARETLRSRMLARSGSSSVSGGRTA